MNLDDAIKRVADSRRYEFDGAWWVETRAEDAGLIVREVRALQARETRMRATLTRLSYVLPVGLTDAHEMIDAALAGLPDTGSDQ